MSWRLHSPNVACAYMCDNREETEYVNGSLDYTDLTNVKPKNLHRSFKTAPPAKIIEQERLYEWNLLMFSELVMNRSCAVKYGYDAIKKLGTKLANKIKIDKDDELEMCIDNTFLPSQFFHFKSLFFFNLTDIPLHNVPFPLPFLISLFVVIINGIPE